MLDEPPCPLIYEPRSGAGQAGVSLVCRPRRQFAPKATGSRGPVCGPCGPGGRVSCRLGLATRRGKDTTGSDSPSSGPVACAALEPGWQAGATPPRVPESRVLCSSSWRPNSPTIAQVGQMSLGRPCGRAHEMWRWRLKGRCRGAWRRASGPHARTRPGMAGPSAANGQGRPILAPGWRGRNPALSRTRRPPGSSPYGISAKPRGSAVSRALSCRVPPRPVRARNGFPQAR